MTNLQKWPKDLSTVVGLFCIMSYLIKLPLMGNLSSSACPILGSPGLMTNNLMLCVYFCNEIGLIFYSSFWSHWMLDWWGLHLAIGGDGYSHFILMGQPRPLFVYFCFFKHKFYRKNCKLQRDLHLDCRSRK